jgi:hypothetical protein
MAPWHPSRVGASPEIAAVLVAFLCVVCTGCKDRPPTPAEIADRGWRAHELVVTAGERAPTCAAAGAAMQRVLDEHRADFAAAMALDDDRQRLAEATDYLEAHQDRYADLETRMAGLSERCADVVTVQAVFAAMESRETQQAAPATR